MSIFRFKGIAVKTTMEAAQTVQYTALISGLTKQVRKHEKRPNLPKKGPKS